MTFKDKNFNDRINDQMFYHSENIFEEKWPGPWERYGLGEKSKDMASWKFDPFISHTPDYRAALTATSKPVLVEVQGTGTNAEVRTHKFKKKKLDALGKWNSIHEVTFWLWDDKSESWIWTSWVSIRGMIARGMATEGSFDGKRPYWAIPVTTITDMSDEDRLVTLYG